MRTLEAEIAEVVVAGVGSVARAGVEAVAAADVDSAGGAAGAAVTEVGAAAVIGAGVATVEVDAGVEWTVKSTLGVCEGRVICCAGSAVAISANASRADAELAEVIFMYAPKFLAEDVLCGRSPQEDVPAEE